MRFLRAPVSAEAAGPLNELFEVLFGDHIREHSRHPRHHHPVADPDWASMGNNPLCGDELALQVKVNAHGVIEQIGIQSRGCAISTASASMMAEQFVGKTVEEAKTLCGAMKQFMAGEPPARPLGEAVQSLESVKKFPGRIPCALLAWDTFQQFPPRP